MEKNFFLSFFLFGFSDNLSGSKIHMNRTAITIRHSPVYKGNL